MATKLILSSLVGVIALAHVARSEQSDCSVAFEDKRIIFKGTAEPIDGDALWLGIHKIRLLGIDALEANQPCTKNGERFPCAEKAYDQLKSLITGTELRCLVDRGKFGKPVMDRNRYLATCYSNDVDVGRAMIASGWALADGELYLPDENSAKATALGIHATIFKAPSEFRKSQKVEDECNMLEKRCIVSRSTSTPEMRTPAPSERDDSSP
jgi:endonuclease YncB( thermonuclease family)